MEIKSLSLTAMTLYAELRELVLAIGVTENLGETPGSVVKKKVRGKQFLYYQYRDLSGATKQTYLGPDDEATQGLVRILRSRSSTRIEDLQRIDELCGAFVAAGGFVTPHPPMRVLKGFTDAGLLRPVSGSAVLVGTHAFNALGNMLGARWSSQIQTQDIDIAADSNIALAVRKPAAGVPEVLAQLEMGFLPVPKLNPKSPSTSFRVRGQDLRVDLLTPLVGKAAEKPVFVSALNAPAHPLRFLDFLIEDAVPGLIIGRKSVLLANIPMAERFALHKLLVSESRTAVMASKADKDRVQAIQLLRVLLDRSPDAVFSVKEKLESRGRGWSDKLRQGLNKCKRLDHETVVAVSER